MDKKQMTPQLLSEVGTWLYGEDWKLPLASALGIHRRTIQRWAAGEFEINNSIVNDLIDLIEAKTKRAARISEKLTSLTSEIKTD